MVTGRTSRDSQPNVRLRALLEEARCSHSGLARRVNTCGRAHGLQLRYDKTSVSRWLQGQRPRGSVPQIIAEALSGKLGRKVTPAEMGLAAGEGAAAEPGSQLTLSLGDVIVRCCALWRSGAQEVGSRVKDHVAVADLVEASRDWLITGPDRYVSHEGPGTVDMSDVEALWATSKALADLDHRFGGGHMRPVILHQLDGVVSNLLQGSYQETVGRQLFAAAARLSELAGYTALDTGAFAFAQQHYVQALRLAQAAGDRAFGGYVLSAGLGRLAIVLGNPREAVQLARTAQEGTAGTAARAVRSVLHAMEARGRALLGDQQGCEAAAGRAAEALDGSGAEDEPRPAVPFDSAYLAGDLARCHRDLNQHVLAVEWAQEEVALHPEWKVRRRGLGLLSLATSLVGTGQAEAGRDTAVRAVRLLRHIRSLQVSTALRGFLTVLESAGHQSVASDFRTFIADSSPALVENG